MDNFDYKKYLVENKLTSNSNLNEESNSSPINLNIEALMIGYAISDDVIKLIKNKTSDDINSALYSEKNAKTFFKFYEKILSTIMTKVYGSYGDSFNTKAGAAPDEY
jgi:hypothetical protein